MRPSDAVRFRHPAAALSLAALACLLAAGLAFLLIAGPVLGQSDETPPTVESAVVDGNTLTLTFSEDLKATDTSGLKWAIWVDGIVEGSSVSPNSAAISGRTLTLTLGAAAEADDTVTVNYDAGAAEEKLQDPAGNEVASFSDQEVRHASEVTEEPTATPVPTPEPTATPPDTRAYARTHAGAHARTHSRANAGADRASGPAHRADRRHRAGIPGRVAGLGRRGRRGLLPGALAGGRSGQSAERWLERGDLRNAHHRDRLRRLGGAD